MVLPFYYSRASGHGQARRERAHPQGGKAWATYAGNFSFFPLGRWRTGIVRENSSWRGRPRLPTHGARSPISGMGTMSRAAGGSREAEEGRRREPKRSALYRCTLEGHTPRPLHEKGDEKFVLTPLTRAKPCAHTPHTPSTWRSPAPRTGAGRAPVRSSSPAAWRGCPSLLIQPRGIPERAHRSIRAAPFNLPHQVAFGLCR